MRYVVRGFIAGCVLISAILPAAAIPSALTNPVPLPYWMGGTGLTAAPTNGQVPIGNGSGYTLAGLTGTSNQVTVTNGAGTITLATPQDIHTAATPTFGGLTAATVTGGTGVGSSLSLKSTSGVGSSDFIDVLVGNNGGTRAARVNTAGEILVNTTSDAGAFPLQVIGDIYGSTKLRIGNVTLDATIKEGINDTTVLSGTNFANQTLDGIGIYNASTTADSGVVLIFELGSASTAYTGIGGGYASANNSYLAFYTESANTVGERMRIDSAGELLVGTTTDSGAYPLQVSGASYLDGAVTTNGAKYVKTVIKVNADSPYTLAATDEHIMVDATSGNVTIDLPDPTVGRVVKFSRHNSGSNTITIDPNDAAGTTINGGAGNKTLGAQIGFTAFCVGVDTNEWNCSSASAL